MSIVLGLDCKLYRGTAGTSASTLVKNVKDVTLNMDKGEADITSRAAQGWRVNVGTLKQGSIEFNINYDTSDADFQAFQAAYFGGTPLALFVSDGAGSGLDCDVSVTAFNISQPLEEACTVSVTCKPTDIGGSSGRAPSWSTNGATA